MRVAAMSYDELATLATFHAEQKLGYPLLRDDNATHVNALGIRNEEYPEGHRVYGIPHPGVLMVDGKGIVRAKYAVPGYRERPPLEEIHQSLVTLLN